VGTTKASIKGYAITLLTCEISIGDYVLTGGEMAAAIMTDAIVRILPGCNKR